MVPGPDRLSKAPRGRVIAAFKAGLRFECTRCGKCCASLAGEFPLLLDDARRLARHLGLTMQTFVRHYCRYVVDIVHVDGGRVRIPSLHLRIPASKRCVFLGADNLCSVHDAKPFVCAQSPFMRYVAESEELWRALVDMCPGIGIGPRYSARRIETLLAGDDAAEARDVAAIRAAGGSLGAVLGVSLGRPSIRHVRWLGASGISNASRGGARG